MIQEMFVMKNTEGNIYAIHNDVYQTSCAFSNFLHFSTMGTWFNYQFCYCENFKDNSNHGNYTLQ